MKRRIIFGSLVYLILLLPALAQERIKLATPIKTAPGYYLPILAAEEKGIWRANGLEVEWVPFRTSVFMYHAITAGSVAVGQDIAGAIIPGIARGVPAILVAKHRVVLLSVLYVWADSPIKSAQEIRKGARIGISSLAAASHMYGRMLLRALGLEKDVRWVAVGGLPQTIAALKSGVVDAITQMADTMIRQEALGEVRRLASLEDYLKEDILGTVSWVRKDLVKTNPRMVPKVIKSIIQSVEFIQANREWTIEKIKAEQGLPQKAAEMYYPGLRFTTDPRIPTRALQDLINYLVEFEVIPKERTPRVEDVYTPQFLG